MTECWICLKPGDMIEPCTKCRGLIHAECLRTYQNAVDKYNERGACRSELKSGWCLPPLTKYDFDFDRYRIVKRDGSFHVTGIIGLFEIALVFTDRWPIIRCLFRPTEFVDLDESDFVFTDDDVFDALDEKRIVFVDQRIVLVAKPMIASVAWIQSTLSNHRRAVRVCRQRQIGQERKRASKERIDAVRKKRG